MNESGKKAAPVKDGKPAGTGPDGSIPVSDEGISLTTTPEGTNFNQEEEAAWAGLPGQARPEK